MKDSKTVDKVFAFFLMLVAGIMFSLFVFLLVKADRYDKLVNDIDFASCVYSQNFDSFNYSYDEEEKAWVARIEKDGNLRSITWHDSETVQAMILKTYCK